MIHRDPLHLASCGMLSIFVDIVCSSCGNFLFLKTPENFDFQAVQHDDDTGYILEVDLHYPDELHNSYSDLPLAPEHLKVMLSDYSNTNLSFETTSYATVQ